MKFLKRSATILLAGILTIGFISQSHAQSSEDYDEQYRNATTAFNKALESANGGDYEGAINMFNQALSLAEQSEYKGSADLIDRVENQLPGLYYQQAVQRYKNFQKTQNIASLDEAVNAFQEAAAVSKDYGDGQIAEKANSIVIQLLYNKSIMQYKSQNHDAALATLDQVIQRDSSYAKAYYQKGLVLKDQSDENFTKAIEMFDKAIEVGQQTNDNQIVRRARNSALNNLVYRGYTASSENNNHSRGIFLLNRALEYDSQSSDAHYRLAEIYNKRGEREQALDHARQALDYETGGKTELAKIYYEVGLAHQALGNEAEACSAFKNAAFGSFKSNAEYKLEHELDCEEESST